MSAVKQPYNVIEQVDFSKQILDSLPENARQYYVEKTDKQIGELVYRLSCTEKMWRNINVLRIYPICCMRYLNSNEFCCAIVNGEHRIYQGPGLHFVVGLMDQIVGGNFVIGDDCDFGPIKLIYVRPGALKFATFRNTGRPLLLGPGMHYFNDINLFIGNEINMNFDGTNQIIRCDTSGSFQFVFVKAGSEAIVITKDGELNVLGPGLHFIQAPDALKCFVNIQQQHFKFGSCDANQYFLTADNVELLINATIFFRIIDVRTMFTTRIKDENDLREVVHSQAMATLLTIIRSEAFQGIGHRKQIQTMNEELKTDFDSTVKEPPPGYTPNPIALSTPTAAAIPVYSKGKAEDVMSSISSGFQNIIHDAEPQFQRIMQENFAGNGLEIQSLRIEQIEFADKTMQKQVSEFAMTNTKLTSQQQTISAQRAIQVAEAERDAATLMIKTKAQADKEMMMTDTENQIKIKTAEAANQILIRTARAEAENKLILAEADAQSKLKIGEAELQIMERQNAMPNAQLRIVTEAQKEVLSGVTKIIYTDQQSMLLKPYLAIPDNLEAAPTGKR